MSYVEFLQNSVQIPKKEHERLKDVEKETTTLKSEVYFLVRMASKEKCMSGNDSSLIDKLRNKYIKEKDGI